MGTWNGQGLGQKIQRPAGSGSAVNDHSRVAASQSPKPGDWLPSRWSSAWGGSLEELRDRLSHAAIAADDFVNAQTEQLRQGWRFNPVAVSPTGQVGLPIQVPTDAANFTGNEDRHALAHGAAPTVAALDQAAQRAVPAHPTLGDKALLATGHAVAAAPVYLNPATAIAASAVDGYGVAKQNALAHGATESTAVHAALGNAVAQGALAGLPVPGAKWGGAVVDNTVHNRLLASGLKWLGAGGVWAGYGGASQAASNAVAQTYDPTRRLSDGVAGAAVQSALFGMALHGAALVPKGVSSAHRALFPDPAITASGRTPTPSPQPSPAASPVGTPSGNANIRQNADQGLTPREQSSNKSREPSEPHGAPAPVGDHGAASATQGSDAELAGSGEFSDLGPAVKGTSANEHTDGDYSDLGQASDGSTDSEGGGVFAPRPSDPPKESPGETDTPRKKVRVEDVPPEEIYNLSCRRLNERECNSLKEYARRVNAFAAENGPFTVTATGKLRPEARKLIDQERRAAIARGEPYQGHVGHVPDMALTGKADPPAGWLGMEPRANATAGGGLAKRIGKKIQLITVDGVAL